MRALFIGGTGNISTAVSCLAIERGWDLYLLNRGQTQPGIPGAESLVADIHQPQQVKAAIQGLDFDVVVNWIAFVPPDIERDLALFRGITKQYIFISSASVYQKPPRHPVITESTPLYNPHWQYSRNKIACEDLLVKAYQTDGYPITIVRPAHTYDHRLPIAVGGGGSYTLPRRLLKGQPIIVHGDGASLWTVTHSEDFAKAFVGLMGHPAAIGDSFHITSDELLTWNQIYDTLAAALGVEADKVYIPSTFIAEVNPSIGAGLIGDKAWSHIFDNSKVKRLVPDYQATIPFHLGLRRTLAWFEDDERHMAVDGEMNAAMDAIIAAYQGR